MPRTVNHKNVINLRRCESEDVCRDVPTITGDSERCLRRLLSYESSHPESSGSYITREIVWEPRPSLGITVADTEHLSVESSNVVLGLNGDRVKTARLRSCYMASDYDYLEMKSVT